MSIKDYKLDPDLNTSISGIDISEGCHPSGINDAIRQIMADVKAGYCHNVLDYGAKGDGTTDDTDAIQAALDAARGGAAVGGSRGGTVVFPLPSSQYLVTDTLLIANGVNVIGLAAPSQNRNPIIKFAGSGEEDQYLPCFAYEGGEDDPSGQGDITNRGGMVKNIGVQLSTPYTIGFKIRNSRDTTWENLMCRAVRNTETGAVQPNNCIGFQFNAVGTGVYDCTFINLYGYCPSSLTGFVHYDLVGGYPLGENSGRVNGNAFINLSARSAGLGFRVGPSLVNGFYGCVCEALTDGYVKFLEGAERNAFHDCYFGDDIHLSTGKKVIEFCDGSKKNAVLNAKFTGENIADKFIDSSPNGGNIISSYNGSIEHGDLLLGGEKAVTEDVTGDTSVLPTPSDGICENIADVADALQVVDMNSAKLGAINQYSVICIASRATASSSINISGGNSYKNGGHITLYGQRASGTAGYFELTAKGGATTDHTTALIGTPGAENNAGTLTWGGARVMTAKYGAFTVPVTMGYMKFSGGSAYNGTDNFIGNSYSNSASGLYGANLYFSTVGVSPSMPDTTVADNVFHLGQSNRRWKEIFCANGTINTSDEREKTAVSGLEEDIINAWGDVEYKLFQYNDALEKKGGNARYHAGVMAQQVQDAFEEAGLDASRYAFFCHDEWDEEKDEEGNVLTPSGDRYGIRYNEALVMEAMYQRARADRLDARLEELEDSLRGLENRVHDIETELF